MGSGAASGEDRARAAAEAAVSSPLLEDINLAGAHGILVNVTAGMDLSIGEFQEVGQIVKQFASDDATVVVGTVIDPELSNQVRVTVVATGLNRPARVQRDRDPVSVGGREPVSVRDRDPVNVPGARVPSGGRNARGAPHPAPSSGDYTGYDKPTIVRQRAVGDGLRTEPDPEELLDIPAFLRRQAD